MSANGGASGAGLAIRGLHKWYGDTRALDGLDLQATPGEILGVAGPNGAGKSTLIKIIAGETRPDSGEIEFRDVPWDPQADPGRVAVVHQEPQLFPNLTVAQNLMVGREGTRLVTRYLDRDERELMIDLAIYDYAARRLGEVPLAIQQRVEIGRALARDARIFLFDEPNSALTQEESLDLFRRMHLLADAGRVVVLVSHRIAELSEHADRVALILDGRCTTILTGDDVSQENIAAGLVTGQAEREVDVHVRSGIGQDAASALRLTGWTHADGEFDAVDLHARVGDVVAIVGVEGSGARELVRSIAGFERASGTIEIAARAGRRAVTSGTGLVSADRQTSLFPNLSVAENMVVRLGREITAAAGALRRGRVIGIARDLRDRFRVKTDSVEVPIRSLSGGNQQKVAIAAAMVRRPPVLVLEEPTRGVDLGSKREIYRLMREYAAEGHTLVIFCTEVPEVFEAADIAYVVSDGKLSPPLMVADYPDVEALARSVTRLERHSRPLPEPAPAPA
jgi:ABC-type sugar transport system ATPase subunit